MEPLPYRSVLITGADGFVGSHLVPALRARLRDDAAVHSLGCTPRSRIDLLDAAALHAVVAETEPDLVIHLAAQSSVAQSADAGAATWRVNVAGTINLAEAVATHSPQAVVAFASSSEVYGAAFLDGPASEETPPVPLSVYARTKRAGEDALHDILAPTNRLVVFRPANHSGAGQDVRFVLPAFADQIAAVEVGRQSPVLHVGSLTAERDFLTVHDVVDAYLAALAIPDLAARETFNIASGEPVAIARLLEELLATTDRTIRVQQDPSRMRPSEIPRAAIDPGKIMTRTSWRPRHTLRSMVAEVLADRRIVHAGIVSGSPSPNI